MNKLTQKQIQDKFKILTPGEVSSMMEEEKEYGKKVVVVDGLNVKDEKSLFAILKRDLSFPDYFGNNWDAFNDSFSFESAISGGNKILILRDFSELLDADRKVFDALFESIVFCLVTRIPELDITVIIEIGSEYTQDELASLVDDEYKRWIDVI